MIYVDEYQLAFLMNALKDRVTALEAHVDNLRNKLARVEQQLADQSHKVPEIQEKRIWQRNCI